MDSILALLTSALAPVVTAMVPILTAAIVTGVVKFINKLGVDVDAKNREALQSALANAAIVALSPAAASSVHSKKVLDVAAEYVEKSVPGALQHFGVSRVKLLDLLEPHLVQESKSKK